MKNMGTEDWLDDDPLSEAEIRARLSAEASWHPAHAVAQKPTKITSAPTAAYWAVGNATLAPDLSVTVQEDRHDRIPAYL